MEIIKKPLFRPGARFASESILADLYPKFLPALVGSDTGFNQKPDIRLISNKRYYSLSWLVWRSGFFYGLWQAQFSRDRLEIVHLVYPQISTERPRATLYQSYRFFCHLFDSMYIARLKHYRRRTKKKKTNKETP